MEETSGDSTIVFGGGVGSVSESWGAVGGEEGFERLVGSSWEEEERSGGFTADDGK